MSKMARGENMAMFLLVISFSILYSVVVSKRDDSFFSKRWSSHYWQEDDLQAINSPTKDTTIGHYDPVTFKLEDKNVSSFVEVHPNHLKKVVFSKVSTTTTDRLMEGKRDKRFFFNGFQDLFNLFIQIKEEPCASPTGDNGTCYKKTECTTLGGTGSGTCGQGQNGVCCIFLKTCGSSTEQNATYFVNTGYPNNFDGVGSCQLLVNKMNSNICQLRLDFVDLTLAAPDASTICNNDRFTVSSADKTPTICGINTGNHIYVNLGQGVSSPVSLSVVTMGPSFSRKWKIKVSQIPCSTSYTAPSNCVQYFTGITGQIKTYNYDPTSGGQLANQDYTSCIRSETRFCGIKYTPCTNSGTASTAQSFTLSDANNPGSIIGATCTTDWVIIPCSTDTFNGGTTNCFDRFCGSLLNIANTGTSTAGNTPVYSSIKPFQVIYHTDSSEVTGEDNNRGYCLQYVQQPCV